MHRLAEENGVLDVYREPGIGFAPYRPINRGNLVAAISVMGDRYNAEQQKQAGR